MSGPYRNEKDAMLERRAALEQEAARLRDQTSELAALRARQLEIEREIAAIDGIGREPSLLDRVRIASPCEAEWADMIGDDRVRFCGKCEKNVFNLSALTREEAEALLRSRDGGEMCVRLYKRADGGIMTTDCPVGVARKRRRSLALAVASMSAVAVSAMRFIEGQVTETSASCPPFEAIGAGPVSPPPPFAPVTASPPVEPRVKFTIREAAGEPKGEPRHAMGARAFSPPERDRTPPLKPKLDPSKP